MLALEKSKTLQAPPLAWQLSKPQSRHWSSKSLKPNTGLRSSPARDRANSTQTSLHAPIQQSPKSCPSAIQTNCCSAGLMCARPNEDWLQLRSVRELRWQVFFLKSAFPDSWDFSPGEAALSSPVTRRHGP